MSASFGLPPLRRRASDQTIEAVIRERSGFKFASNLKGEEANIVAAAMAEMSRFAEQEILGSIIRGFHASGSTSGVYGGNAHAGRRNTCEDCGQYAQSGLCSRCESKRAERAAPITPIPSHTLYLP